MRALLTSLLIMLMMATACSNDRKADRLYDRAMAQAEEGRLDDAIATLHDVVKRYPETPAAGRAREEIVLYDGLFDAVERYPGRETRDVIVRTARAIQIYHRQRGRWPKSLDRLMPDFLGEAPIDPWGRALIYQTKPGGRGYLLASLGSDGAPGGEGDDVDWYVEDGAFVREPSVTIP